MANRNKTRGSINERKTMKYLEDIGFLCTKSGGSLGAFDIIGISKSGNVLVQVKSNRWASPDERDKIAALVRYYADSRTNAFIVRWDNYKRVPKIKMYNRYKLMWIDVESV
jgi:Holliday junction resolvase